MKSRSRVFRKLVYAASIVVLLVVMQRLSMPAFTGPDGQRLPGGKLAELREEYQLSQANLGEIDPASETIKLATLGMRGLAANLLWEKAHYYKKVEDWTSLSATLEQLLKLQRNVIAVWRHQAWNLSYNVSVEFDNFHDRYFWVIRGINFLKDGLRYNLREPRLPWDLGWFIAQKIGRADEKKQYRRLFKADDDFHGNTPLPQRDNWLVGRRWFIEAERVVDRYGVPVRGVTPLMTPLVFRSDPPMCLMNYADVIEEEGTFGETSKENWRRAGEAWTLYGNSDIPTSENVVIRLNDMERFEQAAKTAREELARLVPTGLEERMKAEREKTITEEERAALAVPADERSEEHHRLTFSAHEKLTISPFDLARASEPKNRAAALKAADAAFSAERIAGTIDRYRDIVNFVFWRLRAKVEVDDDTLAAREGIYQGDEAFRAARLDPARERYEAGLAGWRTVLDRYPELITQNAVIDDLKDAIERYQRLMKQLNAELPKPFILQDVLDAELN